MSISESIKAHREARGMTQQQLAERLYITRQAVSRWEIGETTPGIDRRSSSPRRSTCP